MLSFQNIPKAIWYIKIYLYCKICYNLVLLGGKVSLDGMLAVLQAETSQSDGESEVSNIINFLS